MTLSNDEVFDLACGAVQKMFAEHDPDYTFTFDEIWQNVPNDIEILSTSKPHQSKRLINSGWVEKTGEMRRAASRLRAGSSTPEYRFGPKLVPDNRAASTRVIPRVAPSEKGELLSLFKILAPTGENVSPQLSAMQNAMDSEGYIISSAELANFFLAMTVSPLVILSGISGTGKSLLPRKFARLTESKFFSIPVQPQWSDNSDLFGYVPTLSQEQYKAGALIPSLRAAKEKPQELVIALLDEMNLAPVEHYFSDFLSIAETRHRKGSNQDSPVTTDELRIELPPRSESDILDDLRGMRLPTNLRVVGTANMDETTHSFSPKVLDRAFTIELDDPDLTAFASGAEGSGTSKAAASMRDLASSIVSNSNAISVTEAASKNHEMFVQVALMLQELQDILTPAGIKFGYRTRDAILLYLHFWKEFHLEPVLTANAAMDYCILQKILPKISGSGQMLEEVLGKLEKWLKKNRSPHPSKNAPDPSFDDEPDDDDVDSAPKFDVGNPFTGPFTRCVEKTQRMRALLEADGATHFWGT